MKVVVAIDSLKGSLSSIEAGNAIKTGVNRAIADAEVVVTGEGRLDFQTAMGKAPIGVARLAKEYGKKVVAFAGCGQRMQLSVIKTELMHSSRFCVKYALWKKRWRKNMPQKILRQPQNRFSES